jgi:hypothetical protein
MQIKTSLSIKFRPILIFFEKKAWFLDNSAYSDPRQFLRLLESELISVFGGKIFGPGNLDAYMAQHHGQYPTAPELAGFIIPSVIQFFNNEGAFIGGSNLIFHEGPCPASTDDQGCPCRALNLTVSNNDDCFKPGDFETKNIYRVNNYQEDWTYEDVVPPNPIVVDFDKPSSIRIGNCPAPFSPLEIDVHEQGTYRFAYRTVGKAVDRARGEIVSHRPEQPERSGLGWTLLIRPGHYQETRTIDIPLTLKKDDRFPGAVVIGR